MKRPKQETLNQENILSELIIFESKRLSFVPAWNIKIDELITEANDIDVATGIGCEFPYPYKKENAKWYINYVKINWKTAKEYSFAIRVKERDEFIGVIDFKVRRNVVSNIGYWLGRESWGNGYASEALLQTIDFIKMNFPKIKEVKAFTYSYNLISQKILEKSGFKKTGEKKNNTMLRNGKSDESFIYVLNIDNLKIKIMSQIYDYLFKRFNKCR